MSKYATVATDFKDPDLLIAALAAVGYSKVENHIGNPQPLVGFQGDFRTADGDGHTTNPALAMKADIIIRRREVGGKSNDIGFVRTSSGSYTAIISDYDSHKHNQQWRNNLAVNYQQKSVEKIAAKMGARVLVSGKKLANGNIQYQFLKA